MDGASESSAGMFVPKTWFRVIISPAYVARGGGNRADMIVVMFDAHKLDISDELTTAIATLRPHQDKIRYAVSP